MFDWLKRWPECGNPLPALRQRVSCPGDPPGGSHQRQRVHLLHALPGTLFRRPPLPAHDPGAAEARARRAVVVPRCAQRGKGPNTVITAGGKPIPPNRRHHPNLQPERSHPCLSDNETAKVTRRRTLLGTTAAAAARACRRSGRLAGGMAASRPPIAQTKAPRPPRARRRRCRSRSPRRTRRILRLLVLGPVRRDAHHRPARRCAN